ncbi:MAG: sigma-70 family RNA polymerase sigma factor [Nibricoccus sp.]
MNDDAKLLLRYVRDHSQAAFAELVRRHIDLVYSAAVRRCNGDTHKAEDAVQQVFLSLAKNAEKLASHPVLEAWLYSATRNVVINSALAEQRRAKRDEEAAMSALLTAEEPAPDWSELRPVLDDVMDELSEPDRTAVLMRFFKKHSFAEIGASLNISENTARMRTERALEKLRGLLAKRGVKSSAGVLGLVLTRQAVVAAPVAIAVGVTAYVLGLPKGSTISATAGTMKMVLTALVLATMAVLVTVGFYSVRRAKIRSSNSLEVWTATAMTPAVDNSREKNSTVNVKAADDRVATSARAIVAAQLPTADSDPKAVEILQKMAVTYADFLTYQDRSEVTLVTSEGTKLSTVIGQTIFQRAGGFKMVWRRTQQSRDAINGKILNDGRRTEVWSTGSNGQVMPTLLSAFRSEQMLTYGSSYFVPRLLASGDGTPSFPLDEIHGVKLVGEGVVDGVSCYKIVGSRADGALQELLIGKNDYVLRTIKTNLLDPASKTSDKPASIFGVRMEIRWEISFNKVVEDGAFAEAGLGPTPSTK